MPQEVWPQGLAVEFHTQCIQVTRAKSPGECEQGPPVFLQVCEGRDL